MKVTLWTILHEKKAPEFNHLEDGWAEGDYPLPKDPAYTNQAAWANLKWHKEHAELVNHKVMHFGREDE